MVAAPEQYRWSSYSANARGAVNELVKSHPAYEALGNERPERSRAYLALCDSAPPPLVVEEIRKATRRGSVAGAVRRSRGRPTKAK
jgi:putative transposase